MIAAKMLAAALLAACSVSVAGEPLAQAEPPVQSQTQLLSNGPGDPPCPDGGCAPPPPPPRATPPPIRGVLGCVRGVCIPKPNPPRTRR